MILDIREKTPGEALRLKRRLQRDHTGHAAAVGDVLHDFLDQIGEEGKEMIRAEMIRDDAVDTRTGYRRTIAKVVTPSYAYIETPRYIRTLSEGRTPYYVSARELEPWVTRRIFSGPHPDQPRYRADFDQTEIDVIRETAEAISLQLATSGTRPRRWFERLASNLKRRRTMIDDMMRRALYRRFWR